MKIDVTFSPEQLAEPDVQKLLRVYAFLLKRVRQHRRETAAVSKQDTPQTTAQSTNAAEPIATESQTD